MGSKPPAALAIWRRTAEVRLWDWTSTFVKTGPPGASSHALRRRRSFTPQFKAQVLLEVLSGQRSASESARQHKLKPGLISRWKDIALEGLFQGDDQRAATVTASPSWRRIRPPGAWTASVTPAACCSYTARSRLIGGSRERA